MRDRSAIAGVAIGAARIALLCVAFGATAPSRAQPLPPAPPGGSTAPTATAKSAAAIDGFRSATFGMTETEVRAAIAEDFHLAPAAVRAGENSVQRTTILSVHVADLVPGGGTAIVSYIFGYQSHRLIEVNIIWSKETDPALTAARLATIGATLQSYFAGENFPPQSRAMSIPVRDGLLLFRATDTVGHAVVLILSGRTAKDQKTGKTSLTPTTLSVAYAANAAHPDVFTLKKGSF